MTQQTLDKEKTGPAVGKIAGGLYIVTAQEPNGNKVGMLASWVQQAGFEPLCVSVAIVPDREIYKAIQESKTFTINVLAKGSNHLMKPFSHYQPDQFDQVQHQATDFGIDLAEAAATIHCRLKDSVAVGDHHLVIGEVVGGELHQPDAEIATHIRKSGLHY